MRTSTRRGRVPPTRKNVPVSIARRSFTWLSGSISPISSRNSVPPSASSTRPGLVPTAPVNAPFSWPNSSDSNTSRGRAPQWIGTNARSARTDCSWMARATSSLPVPLSPRTSTVESVGATRSMRPQHFGLHPGAPRQDAAEGRRAGCVGAQRDVVAKELPLLRRLADDDVQLFDLGRLGQVVVGAELHGLHRGGDVLEAGHHDHLRRLRDRRQLAQDVDALLLRHPHVENDDVERPLANPLERGGAVGRSVDLVSAPGQLADDQLAQVPLVVGHQHADRARHSGSTTRKVLPLPEHRD